jgi:copper chaperone CopZ
MENQHFYNISISGLSCSSCANKVDTLFEKMETVKSATTQITTGKMLLELHKGRSLSELEIAGKIAEAGFTMENIESLEKRPARSLDFNPEIKLELFSAECRLCERTIGMLEERFPGLPLEIHKASECTDGSCCQLAEGYNVNAVPSLVLNGKLLITGIPKNEDLEKLAEMIL